MGSYCQIPWRADDWLCAQLSASETETLFWGRGHSKRGEEIDRHLPVALDKVYTDQEEKTPETIKVLGNLSNRKQGNYSLRRPPKLIIPQIFTEQRWATVIEFISV